MQQVSTVEFRNNIYKYIKVLPIEVTAKGKSVFFVYKEKPSQALTQKEVITSSAIPIKNEEIQNKVVEEKPKEVVKEKVVVPYIRVDKPISNDAPMFCSRHRAARIGEEYTCGCKVK